MPQSFHFILIHLIWSTRKRFPFIKPEIETELYKYMAAIFRENKSPALAINGTETHVHVLINLSRSVNLSKLIEEVKASSSKWIKSKGPEFRKFYWQTGYAGFSWDYFDVETIKNYINNQKEHHKKHTYETEFINFLEKNSIEYDERYVWD